MITFDLGADLEMFRNTALDFAKNRLRPAGRAAEDALAAPDELKSEYVDLGFAALELPEAVGGLGLGLTAKVVVEEALAFGDIGLALAMPGPGPFGAALLELADESTAATYLQPMIENGGRGAVAWSEEKPKPRSFSTVAVAKDDGFALTGKKAHVVLGHEASNFVVFANREDAAGHKRLGAFVVPRTADGIRFSEPRRALGLNAAPTTTMTLEDTVVAADRELTPERFEEAAMRMWCRISLVGAARAVGLALAAFEYAKDYAADRQAFGKPIAHFQGLAFLIADMATTVEVMRAMVARAAWAMDRGDKDATKRVAMASAECHQGVMFVTNQAVQVLGGAGFVDDHPAEKWMRDAKAHMSYGLGTQLADLIVSRRSLGGTGVDLEEDLPMPELQPVMV